MQQQFQTGLVWFRRDLRTHDNAALNTALQQCNQVHCVFIFDRAILDSLPRADRRVAFIHASLQELDASLRQLSGKPDGGLIVRYGFATEEIPALAAQLGAQAVYAARDYEPQARARDFQVQTALLAQQARLITLKDHVIFEEREVLTQTGKPYGVFTPYMRAWLAKLGDVPPRAFDEVTPHAPRLAERPPALSTPLPSLGDMGFEPGNLPDLRIPTGMSGAKKLLEDFWERMDQYEETRNFPSVKGPSYLSVHLRFGTVSIRQLVGLALQRRLQGSEGASVWLSELVWRDFYFQVLANFPHVAEHAFKPEYDQIAWESGEHAQQLFQAWCGGRTGYPLVDAAMAQLNQTGYMHNRLRMVAGSFLVKHLGLDWRWGERYFAEQLNDFDLSANNGGWQWVSSSGCDAQPYFRIFNPINQSEKFDAQGKFIKRYLPQLGALDAKSIHAPWLAKPLVLAAAGVTLGTNYPHPIVDHAEARARTLQRYGVVRKTQDSTGVEQ
ncbi:cryptochrome/photolyase family protein [Rhodoferax saidenbachensis]|uniref:Deoxyribodipyrimidine photo-lyase n=1 Tax=Rhodoferax saidenbachensis TaxID=1484693 RepID=A0A1P8KDF8_9BURK|nr:deoxyribodipyrimidine photo-lyase [Rhodoferax saidenbachensis]APW44034.1 deoxyribodipyrimidine photo-lyase [Rhodoferax saidenbachensis]